MSAHDIFADEYEDDIVDASRVRWPSPAWRGRHVEFARDVLGRRTLAKHQRKILDAYYSASRVDIVVCTGQKLGKTETEIIIACFDFATEPGLEGLVIGPVLEHSGKVFWKRFCLDMLAAFYPCAECIPAHRSWCALVDVDPFDKTPRPDRCDKCSPLIPSKLRNARQPEHGRVSEWLAIDNPEKGLTAPDGRTIRAHATNKEGAKGGFSGCVRIYADECSDVSDETRRACKGNLTGGGKSIWFGNLLHPHGWFARAFKTDQALFTAVFQISSRLSPNIPGPIVWSDGKKTPINDNAESPISGMADFEGIESNLEEWKRTPNYIAARIDAEHIKQIEGQLATMAVVVAAEKRWEPANDGQGILQFGVDVARKRDKLAIAARRGNTILEIFAEALNQEDHVRGVEIVLEYGRKHRRAHERKPRLAFDESGPEGQAFRKELYAQKADEFFDIYPVQMGAPPRNRKLYDKRRDELADWFCSKWLKHGAIPTNANLQAQLEATTGKTVEVSYGAAGHKWDVLRVLTNDELRKLLDGESPDERNACELAVWDVDAPEVYEQTLAAPDATTTRPDTPQSKRATPANDIDFEAPLSHHDRYAAAYGRRA